MSGGNPHTRNTLDQDKKARMAAAKWVADNPDGDHLQDVCRLRLLLDMLALLPGQESSRVSSLAISRDRLSPMAGGMHSPGHTYL